MDKNKSNNKQEYSPQDNQALEQAKYLLEITESPGYLKYLKPYLIQLAQGCFPNPKDYRTKEEMILPYTEAYGTAKATRDIVTFLESQSDIVKNIHKKNLEQDSPI